MVASGSGSRGEAQGEDFVEQRFRGFEVTGEEVEVFAKGGCGGVRLQTGIFGVSEKVSEKVSQEFSEKEFSGKVFGGVSGKVSQGVFQGVSGEVAEKVSKKVSQEVCEKVSEGVSEKVAEEFALGRLRGKGFFEGCDAGVGCFSGEVAWRVVGEWVSAGEFAEGVVLEEVGIEESV